jgi:hypothetical protein
MQNEQFWRSASKIYCDGANMAVMGGLGNMFLLSLHSGGNAQVFSFTPEHAKRLSQLVSHHIKSYEEVHGLINVDDWTPEMKAPFQVKDLKD